VKLVAVKLAAGVDERVVEEARAQGVTRSEIVRRAIMRYLAPGARRESASFLAQARHLAGCVEGPVDLSTTEAHLDGYGR
jgi:hypothetical protein